MGVYGGTLEASRSTVVEPEVSRGERYEGLYATIVGSRDSLRMRTNDGCIRQFYFSEGAYFEVPGSDPNDPNAVATAFLDTWSDLFMFPSGAADFEITDLRSSGSSSFVDFRQTYAGLEVYCGEIIVELNSIGGVRYVISTIMTDASVLDAGPDRLESSLTGLEAQRFAEAHMNDCSSSSTCFASTPSLIIYDPGFLAYRETLASSGAWRLR